jgi:hypothetical protein
VGSSQRPGNGDLKLGFKTPDFKVNKKPTFYCGGQEGNKKSIKSRHVHGAIRLQDEDHTSTYE